MFVTCHDDVACIEPSTTGHRDQGGDRRDSGQKHTATTDDVRQLLKTTILSLSSMAMMFGNRGEIWDVYCEHFGDNWPRFNGVALYLSHNSALFFAGHMTQAHSAYEMVDGIPLVATHDESSLEVSRPFKHSMVANYKHCVCHHWFINFQYAFR